MYIESDPPTTRDKNDDVARVAEAGRLRLSGLSVRVGDQPLLTDTTLVLPTGKIIVIVGGSGAGKSVLLRVLAGLLPRDGDVIRWSGDVELTGGRGERGGDSTPLGRRVGVVFQQFALFDELSPAANVQFAIDHRPDRNRQPTQTAKQWLSELGVPPAAPVAGLSGGQKQRLAIARTLAAEPAVVFYDEPTSGLDAASGTKVAALIRQTQQAHERTSIVVTHDYETLIPIADEVLFLDGESKKLVLVPADQWATVASRMKPPATDAKPDRDRSRASSRTPVGWLLKNGDNFLIGTTDALTATLRLPVDLLPIFPRLKWAARFWLHYLRLVGGPSAWVYLTLAGLIAGFTTTFFTFRFLPFRLYTQPLLIDELLASIGFALYRILVPVLATILIAARCGAAVAADVGVKQYGGQVDAMKTLGVRPQAYLLIPILLAFLVATPVLEWVAFFAARTISLVTFVGGHPEIPSHFWDQHFFRNVRDGDALLSRGFWWVLGKNAACGVGTAVISYHQGLRPKQSASDVSGAITSTVLWTTLLVLFVHFLVALIEF